MIFGTGLVKTGNDFGSQGDRPTHPELLDWLATEFMRPRQRPRPGKSRAPSLQAMSRPTPGTFITCFGSWSRAPAYRQSALVSADRLRRDPYNRLLTRGPRTRLEAELIRDNALAISGLLNPRSAVPASSPISARNLGRHRSQVRAEQGH